MYQNKLTWARATAAASSPFFTSSINAWHLNANLTSARASRSPGRCRQFDARSDVTRIINTVVIFGKSRTYEV